MSDVPFEYDNYPYAVDPIVLDGLCRHLVQKNYLPDDAHKLVMQELVDKFGAGSDGFYMAYLWQPSSDLRILGVPRAQEWMAARDAVTLLGKYLSENTAMADLWFTAAGTENIRRWLAELLAVPVAENDESFWMIVQYRLSIWLDNVMLSVLHVPSERGQDYSHADAVSALLKLQAVLALHEDLFGPATTEETTGENDGTAG